MDAAFIGSSETAQALQRPDSVDTERIEARSRNGVLEIKIEKQPKAQPRRIKVA
jgi:HSP20 family molecular chaperone IbpA